AAVGGADRAGDRAHGGGGSHLLLQILEHLLGLGQRTGDLRRQTADTERHGDRSGRGDRGGHRGDGLGDRRGRGGGLGGGRFGGGLGEGDGRDVVVGVVVVVRAGQQRRGVGDGRSDLGGGADQRTGGDGGGGRGLRPLDAAGFGAMPRRAARGTIADEAGDGNGTGAYSVLRQSFVLASD